MMRLCALLRALRADMRGLALIEFAFCVPFLLLLFVGGFQLSDGVFAYRKVTQTARTVADLASQYTEVTNADLDLVLNASQQVLTPYKLSAATIRVSQITVNSSALATVNWSRSTSTAAYPDGAYATGATFTVPSTTKLNGTTVVLSEISYRYVPSIASQLIGPVTLKEQVYMSPRKSTTITKK